MKKCAKFVWFVIVPMCLLGCKTQKQESDTAFFGNNSDTANLQPIVGSWYVYDRSGGAAVATRFSIDSDGKYIGVYSMYGLSKVCPGTARLEKVNILRLKSNCPGIGNYQDETIEFAQGLAGKTQFEAVIKANGDQWFGAVNKISSQVMTADQLKKSEPNKR